MSLRTTKQCHLHLLCLLEHLYIPCHLRSLGDSWKHIESAWHYYPYVGSKEIRLFIGRTGNDKESANFTSILDSSALTFRQSFLFTKSAAGFLDSDVICMHSAATRSLPNATPKVKEQLWGKTHSKQLLCIWSVQWSFPQTSPLAFTFRHPTCHHDKDPQNLQVSCVLSGYWIPQILRVLPCLASKLDPETWCYMFYRHINW